MPSSPPPLPSFLPASSPSPSSPLQPRSPHPISLNHERAPDSPTHDLPPLPTFPPRSPNPQPPPSSHHLAASPPTTHQPLARSASHLSQRSARTFVESASMITALPDMARQETRASRVGKGFTVAAIEEGKSEKDGSADSEGGNAEAQEYGCGEEKVVAVQITPDGQEFTFPDGGRQAWLVLFGAWCALFVSFGLPPAAGAFQTYYGEHFLSAYSDSQIAWIGSCQACVCFGLAAFTGALFDKYGSRPLLTTGTFCVTLGYCLLSLSSKFYQIFLCHATIIPIGMNLLFISPVGVVGQWWALRRGMAFGIITTGGAVGSGFWPIIWTNVPQKIGFGWTMRLIALICLCFGTIASIFIKTRLPPRPHGPFFHFEAFRMVPYSSLAAASFCWTFAFFIWMFFIGKFAKVANVGPVGPYLLTILQLSSVSGRLASGIAADRFGLYNVTIIAGCVQVVACAAWFGCKTAPSLIAICVIFGMASGVWISLQSPMSTKLCDDMRLAGTYIGQILVFQSLAQLIGPPIAGAILGHGSPESQLANFPGAIGLAFGFLCLALGFWTLSRYKLDKRFAAAV